MDEPALSQNALKGKIARLPGPIKEEVSRRIHDGQPGSVILPWLNDLPEVKAILAAQFDGIPVHDVNLTTWRKTGYQDWVRRRERIERTKELAGYAAEVAKANGGTLAAGAASIATGKLLELLEEIDEASGAKLSSEDLISVAGALAGLRTVDQNDIRLAQNDKRLSQKDEIIALEKQKFQRDTAEIALKILADERAKKIEAGTGTNAQKIEMMGQHIFGDLWKPRQPAGK